MLRKDAYMCAHFISACFHLSITCFNHRALISVTNIKMNNVWMMLRKCCNHPYLLEFPMTPDGQFRVDEEIVNSCGKIMLLDRMLPALIKEGHKVWWVWAGV